MKGYRKDLWFFPMVLAVTILASSVIAETIHVDSRNGSDANSGTEKEPLRTLGKAAEMINRKTKQGPTTIKVAPGIYNLSKCVVFKSTRPYTEKDRLVIEAAILPDDLQWKPTLMPVVLSTEDPRKQGKLDGLTETLGLKIELSHVTIRGLRFLGNPSARNWHCCVSRIGDDLDDLVVTQCMFIGDRDALDIYCAVLATGDRFVVDHNIFYNCHSGAVFWDGPQGIPGKGNTVRYCIVNGAYIAGVWTCQTAEDFEFGHNIVTRSEYFWMRKRITNPKKYRLHDCIVSNNKNYSGYGIVSGPTGRTGPEVTYNEKNVIKEGQVVLVKDKRAKNYLHVVEGTFGSGLGAGLFRQ